MSNKSNQTAMQQLKSNIQDGIENLSGELNEYQCGYKQCLIDLQNEIDSKFLEFEKEQILRTSRISYTAGMEKPTFDFSRVIEFAGSFYETSFKGNK